ncbi:hypothetical protein PIB30_050118 [Stylosanthes scabra]|uniref:Uncharacterized protein n=1 Tax=Stylosanthes scabra TaxID=79078 RepID=A0ABU6SI75_9FABA|nr:hypothetical protein [Stylosanthes scabra]
MLDISSSSSDLITRSSSSSGSLNQEMSAREAMTLFILSDSQTLDLGKYTESYQVIYHNEVEYRSHED